MIFNTTPKKAAGILILIMMLAISAVPASASTLDDINSGIGNLLSQAQTSIRQAASTLGIPGVGTVTVSCQSGETCAYSGDNWHITTDILSSNQNLALTLPAGTVYKDTSTNTQMTTGTDVKLTIRPDRAEITKAVNPMTLKYSVCSWGLCIYHYPIPGYEPSGASSYKTIFYHADLVSASGTYTKDLQFDYMNQQAFTIQDNAGNQARMTPKYVIDSGYNLELAGIVYLDNGYGTYRPYTQASLINAYNIVENGWYLTNAPSTWLDYITLLKKQGLIEVTDIGQPVITNNQVKVQYPGGTVGITGDILIPKAMASTVTVRLNYGSPRVDSVTSAPDPITATTGSATITVKATNTGESADWFTLGLNQNVGDVNYQVNRLWIEKGQQGTFIATVRPNGINAQNAPIQAIVTASGSYLQDSKTITMHVLAAPQDCGILGCGAKQQTVKVTVYQPDGKSVLSNAPIYQNNQQIGTGTQSVDLSFGTYTFSTDNRSNPTLFAPSPETVTLSGGSPIAVSLYMTTTPQGEDYTWIFWLVLGIIIIAAIYFSGLWRYILRIFGFVLVNPWMWIYILYGIAAIIIILLIWGISNSIANFRLF